MNIVLLSHGLSVGGGLTVGKAVTDRLPKLLPGCQFLISVPASAKRIYTVGHDNVRVIHMPSTGLFSRWLWERNVLRREVASFEPDWILGLGNLSFPRGKVRQSILFHDAHHVYSGSSFGQVSRRYRFKKWVLKQLFRRSLARADSVYTQTTTIRQRLHDKYRFPLEKIHLFPPAYARKEEKKIAMAAPEGMAESTSDLKLLYISAPWGHKNHQVLIDTFKRHRNRLGGVRCFITVDPRMTVLGRSILEEIDAEGLNEQIITLGHLSPTEVQASYRAADALIFPSILETAGLPLVEAMEYSLPVLASDLDFAHELCGEAAGFFDPHCPESVADSIVRLRDDLDFRTDLARRSAERFEGNVKTWEEALEEIIRIEELRG